MAYTTADIIAIAKASQFLAHVDIKKGGLYGQRPSVFAAKLLYLERKSVEWMYNLSPTHISLTNTANYLYSLCTGYNLQAAAIVATGGGGSISPASPNGYSYTSLGFTVTDDNVTTYQTPYLIGGKDLAFIIYNDLLLTLAKGEFTVNYTTGVVSFTTVSLFVGDSLTFSFNKKI